MDRIEGFHDLLARARSGDRIAAERLLALMRSWIQQVAQDQALFNHSAGSVSDLVQDAWLRAWQKLDQFHGAADEAQSLAMFRSWLARIVKRLGINAARDAGAQQRHPAAPILRLTAAPPSTDSGANLDPPASGPTPSANLQSEERIRLVREALARLTNPLDRDIIRLRFFEGLSLRQVAQQIGCNQETVRLRYHALLQRLQQNFKGLA